MHFHDTINEDNPQHERRATTQEIAVLAVFRAKPMEAMTPIMVCLDELHLPERKLTSIRRAITNLTDPAIYGHPTPLIKTDKKIKERYGVENYLWRLNPGYVRGIQLSLI